MQRSNGYMRSAGISVALVGALLAWSAPATAQRFAIVAVDVSPVDINEVGQVLGRSSIWKDGVLEDLGIVAGPYSRARALNDLGQVVGNTEEAEGGGMPVRGFFWADGRLTHLGARTRVAFGVNNASVVVGFEYVVLAAGEPVFGGCGRVVSPFDQFGYGGAEAFLWSDGVMTSLAAGTSFFATQARDINDAMQVVGYGIDISAIPYGFRAFIWQGETMVSLPGVGGEAHAINERGQVVGRARPLPLSASQAVLWENGEIVQLGTLGGEWSGAWDINDHGQVVGWAQTAELDADRCPIGHGFLWENGQMFDLNDRLPPDSGWELLDARAINNRGQIVGHGLLNGEQQGFLLTPITGDTDGDGDVDLADLLTFDACFSGPGAARPDEPACVEVDLDADGDVDLADLVAFQANLTGSQ